MFMYSSLFLFLFFFCLTQSGGRFKKYEPISWNNDPSAVPTCLLESLETFEFADYRGRQEERDFVSFIIKHACHLKSSTITPSTIMETCSSADSCCI